MDDTSQAANRILLRLVSDKEARVKFGLKQRQAMMSAIKRGEEPQGYRPDWIRNTVRAVFQTLAEKAMEFNEIHPQDRISNHDLADVIATCASRLRNTSK